MLERARRRRAEDYRACGALVALLRGRSTRTLDHMSKMPRRFWAIDCYDSTKLLYSLKVPVNDFTDQGIAHALRALTAREGLEPIEILGAYARRNRRSYAPLLEVTGGGKPYVLMCGTNPHVVARIVEEDDPDLAR